MAMVSPTEKRRSARPGPGLAALVATLTLATGCFEPARELDIDGVHVALDDDAAAAPFARDPGFPARLERMMRLGARYWSGSEDLAPWRAWQVRLEATTFNCGSLEGGAVGCTDHVQNVISVSTKDPGSYHYKFQVACVEMTELIHEMGHAYLGDGDHRDPRWRHFGDVYRELFFPADGSVDRDCQYDGYERKRGYDGRWDG
jgi:hypothetical protein